MHVVLVSPEIAPNTGNIIRLCANTGAALHLIEPLGFALDDKLLKRAGLDYHEHASLSVHPDMESVATILKGRWFGFSSAGSRSYSEVEYRADDVVIFGAERAGLSAEAKMRIGSESLLRIPMMPNNRSLNLANAVSVVVYEAWRQRSFAGSAQSDVATSGSGLTSESTAGIPFDS